EWSLGILLHDLSIAYHARTTGETPHLPALPVQYADYAAWQRQRLQGERLQQLLDYWRNQLDGAPALIELPIDLPRPPVQSYRGERVAFELRSHLTSALEALSQSAGATLFMTLSAAFSVLLSRYSNQRDLCIGTPIAGRQRSEFESLIG